MRNPVLLAPLLAASLSGQHLDVGRVNGLAWGTGLNQVKGLRHLDGFAPYEIGTWDRPGEQELDGLKVGSISYLFFNRRFCGIRAPFREAETMRTLLRFLAANYQLDVCGSLDGVKTRTPDPSRDFLAIYHRQVGPVLVKAFLTWDPGLSGQTSFDLVIDHMEKNYRLFPVSPEAPDAFQGHLLGMEFDRTSMAGLRLQDSHVYSGRPSSYSLTAKEKPLRVGGYAVQEIVYFVGNENVPTLEGVEVHFTGQGGMAAMTRFLKERLGGPLPAPPGDLSELDVAAKKGWPSFRWRGNDCIVDGYVIPPSQEDPGRMLMYLNKDTRSQAE